MSPSVTKLLDLIDAGNVTPANAREAIRQAGGDALCILEAMRALAGGAGGSGGSAAWGGITGTLADQTDLAAALTAKATLAGATFTGAVAVTPGTLATTGLRLAQTFNSPGTTCRGLELAITNTNSAAASTFFRVCGGAAGTTELFGINAAGWITGPASGTMVIAPAAGNNLNLYPTAGGNITTNGSLVVNAGINMLDGQHITVGTSSGMRLGTATSQKLAFWNATPVVQQVLATGSTTDQVITLLQTLGLCRQS